MALVPWLPFEHYHKSSTKCFRGPNRTEDEREREREIRQYVSVKKLFITTLKEIYWNSNRERISYQPQFESQGGQENSSCSQEGEIAESRPS